MINGFELKSSDRPGYHWLIIKREDKTDGFCLKLANLNGLRALIENYVNTLEPTQVEIEQN
jgi:hypothetical protein